jgi:hypothetical protein
MGFFQELSDLYSHPIKGELSSEGVEAVEEFLCHFSALLSDPTALAQGHRALGQILATAFPELPKYLAAKDRGRVAIDTLRWYVNEYPTLDVGARKWMRMAVADPEIDLVFPAGELPRPAVALEKATKDEWSMAVALALLGTSLDGLGNQVADALFAGTA